MIGRPRGYDEAHVLSSLVSVFWKHGFQATTYEQLVQASGLHRQSLYQAFGDKDALYEKALQHYSQNVTQLSLDVLNADGSPLNNIRRWLLRLGNRANQCRTGCLLTNTAIELAPHDDRVRKLVVSELERVELALRSAVKQAINAGELAPECKPPELATYLLGIAQGLMVLARSGVAKKKLSSFVSTALQTVPRIHS